MMRGDLLPFLARWVGAVGPALLPCWASGRRACAWGVGGWVRRVGWDTDRQEVSGVASPFFPSRKEFSASCKPPSPPFKTTLSALLVHPTLPVVPEKGQRATKSYVGGWVGCAGCPLVVLFPCLPHPQFVPRRSSPTHPTPPYQRKEREREGKGSETCLFVPPSHELSRGQAFLRGLFAPPPPPPPQYIICCHSPG